MTKKRLERGLVVLLFVLVLVIFSFAERDSKKLDRLYSTAQLLQKYSQRPADVAQEPSQKDNSGN